MKRFGAVPLRGELIRLIQVKRPLVMEVELDGKCDPPGQRNRAIRVTDGLTPERELDVWIHEMLHACFWDLDEEAVAEAATDIAHALLVLGYERKPTGAK